MNKNICSWQNISKYFAVVLLTLWNIKVESFVGKECLGTKRKPIQPSQIDINGNRCIYTSKTSDIDWCYSNAKHQTAKLTLLTETQNDVISQLQISVRYLYWSDSEIGAIQVSKSCYVGNYLELLVVFQFPWVILDKEGACVWSVLPPFAVLFHGKVE